MGTEDVPTLIDGDQLWREILPQAIRGKPALFLDRDGVIVVETDISAAGRTSPSFPAEVVAAANRGGIAVLIVTNQAGIGRGKFGWAELASVQEQLPRPSRPKAHVGTPSMPVRTIRAPKGSLVTRIIRRASPILEWSCAPRRISPLISPCPGWLVTRRATLKPRNLEGLRAHCRWQPGMERSNEPPPGLSPPQPLKCASVARSMMP
jgi:hypothetical protein